MAIPVGTRVRCIRGMDGNEEYGIAGRIYTVIQSGIEFGGWIKIVPNGPRCGDLRFEIVAEENPPEGVEEVPFVWRVGQKVEFTRQCSPMWGFGPHSDNKFGTIVGVNPNTGQPSTVRYGHNNFTGIIRAEHVRPVDNFPEEVPAAPQGFVWRVGQKVKFTDACERGWGFGPHTENNKYGVIRTLEGGRPASVFYNQGTIGWISSRHVEPIDDEEEEIPVVRTRDVFLLVFDRNTGGGLETASYLNEAAAVRRVTTLRAAGTTIHSHKKITVKLI